MVVHLSCIYFVSLVKTIDMAPYTFTVWPNTHMITGDKMYAHTNLWLRGIYIPDG